MTGPKTPSYLLTYVSREVLAVETEIMGGGGRGETIPVAALSPQDCVHRPQPLKRKESRSGLLLLLHCCLTSTEARWLIRDGDRVGRGRQSEGSTADTARKRPERPWTAARTMEVLRRCPLAIAQRLVHCAISLSTAVLDRVTKTMSVAPLLTNNLDNSKQKTSNLISPAPPPYS